MATGLDYYSLREFDSHSFLAKNCICPVTVRFLMIDLDTDYTHDYHFDNRIGVPDYNLWRAIDTAADYLTNQGETAPTEIVVVAHNYIDLEIHCDLVDNWDCNYFHSHGLLGN